MGLREVWLIGPTVTVEVRSELVVNQLEFHSILTG